MSASIPDSNGFGNDFETLYNSLPYGIEESSAYLHRNLFPRQFCKGTWKVPEENFEKALKNVERLIESDWGQALAMPLDDMQARYSMYSRIILLKAFTI